MRSVRSEHNVLMALSLGGSLNSRYGVSTSRWKFHLPPRSTPRVCSWTTSAATSHRGAGFAYSTKKRYPIGRHHELRFYCMDQEGSLQMTAQGAGRRSYSQATGRPGAPESTHGGLKRRKSASAGASTLVPGRHRGLTHLPTSPILGKPGKRRRPRGPSP